jgi:uncharacterized membrane protein
MSIVIRASRFFDIIVAGGLIFLLISLSSGNAEASEWGWDLITLGVVAFFAYLMIKMRSGGR